MPERRHIVVQGAVQGVGYRPFVYRLAHDLGVDGWVTNTAQGVVIEAEAEESQLGAFLCGIQMCDHCRAEYENPLDRRFHAQPNACPDCGPQLALWDKQGNTLASRDEALLATAQALREGRVVAVKGLGGFHLMVDARNSKAIATLRERKGRKAKPLALMVPSLESLQIDCEVSDQEAALLQSTEAPIVLLRRKAGNQEGGDWRIAEEVAPGNPNLGAMLPYTPLHHLLLKELGFPIVATSGNLSGEPI